MDPPASSTTRRDTKDSVKSAGGEALEGVAVGEHEEASGAPPRLAQASWGLRFSRQFRCAAL